MVVGIALRWTLVGVTMLTLILVPFALFDEQVTSWSLHWTAADIGQPWIALAVVALLAADIVLPVPSSLVSTAAGATLGFALGSVASTVGMTLSSQLGYVLGRKLGPPVVSRLVSADALQQASWRLRDKLFGGLVVMRAVPVFAEASVVMAGVLRVEPTRFLLSTGLANVGISLAYAAVGSLALETSSFLAAFAGAIALPMVALRIAGLRLT